MKEQRASERPALASLDALERRARSAACGWPGRLGASMITLDGGFGRHELNHPVPGGLGGISR